MKNIALFLIVGFIILNCESQNKDAVINDKDGFSKKVDQLVKQYMDIDIYSGVVLIAEKGEPVYHKAFGLANRDTNVKNELNTRFDIGSMNKSFTKVVVLQLVEEGMLNLDDSLGKFLKGFSKEAAEKITVEQLLNHRSGFGGYHTPEYWNIPLEDKSLNVALEYIKKRPLNFKPGTEQDYSNAGYVILGGIIESVTGKSYFEVIDERIIKPLGMKDTFLKDKYNVPNRAIGYYKDMKGNLLNNDSFEEISTPAGGFYSTTLDMLKFYRAYHYGDSLWDESTRQMNEDYEFYKEHQNSGGAMTHAGGFEGANTVVYEILRDQISVIVFANMDEVVAENLGAGILAIIRDKEPKEPKLPAVQSVYRAYSAKGIDFIKNNWEDLTENFHPSDPKDMILNIIGYNFLQDGKLEDALKIFKLNTQLFPEIGNCWDSYGEALLKNGKDKEALKAYKKALSINPNIPTAQEAVKKLEN